MKHKTIIKLLYNKVKLGKMALDKVPTPYQEEVEKLLGSDE